MAAKISDKIFLGWVEKFISMWRYKATEFGRLAIGDPNLVAQLRDGRTIMLSTVERVLLFMEGGAEKHSPAARLEASRKLLAERTARKNAEAEVAASAAAAAKAAKAKPKRARKAA